ncbi:hypothetical protein DOTSEDRAFT_54065 [Dothistroma septosporum NZE10]|uniref:Uncharacterized protein n=1 Tax=Dothistroma septosporum (strain NZE10 / CBS 128990) TaxID=675120 RepID=M2Y4F1_DOTSN|nr:hypothetical protein DOTSEDRAFT_54065 [Dothistroma septosporum NZE10]
MTKITEFLALAAVTAGAYGVTDSCKDLECAATADTTQEVQTLFASPLIARGNKVSCHVGHGWNEDVQGELEHFISDFDTTYEGKFLAHGTECAEWYTASNGAKFYLSINNRACDSVKVEQAVDAISLAVHNCRIEGSDQYSGGAVDYNISPDAPSGCGQYVIFYSSSDMTAAISRPSKRATNVCSTCPQFCLNSFSTCNPPVWSGCTQPEKDCILSEADSFYSCLIAGNCARYQAKVKRRSGPCSRCSKVCLLQDTTCNPPVWTTCTPTEKECLLDFASDYMGCLMAGNCFPGGGTDVTVTPPSDGTVVSVQPPSGTYVTVSGPPAV